MASNEEDDDSCENRCSTNKTSKSGNKNHK